jgi:hypothetical protein
MVKRCTNASTLFKTEDADAAKQALEQIGADADRSRPMTLAELMQRCPTGALKEAAY